MVKEIYEVEFELNVGGVNKSLEDASMDKPKFRMTPLQNVTSAFVGGVVTSITMTPLDVVKTRLQVQQGKSTKFFFYCNGLMDHLCPCVMKEGAWYHRPSKFNGTLDGIRKISKQEGLFSLWSGLTPTLLSALPSTVFYFASYEELKVWLNGRYSHGHLQPLWVPFASAVIARFFTVLISSPLELIRTKMQAKSMSYLEVHQALKSLVYFEGYGGLWKGLGATLLRDTTFSGVYWFGYEAIKSMYPDFKLPFLTSFLAGTTSGVIASVVTTPFDVIKTQIQILSAEEVLSELPVKNKTSMLSMFHQVYTKNGFRGLFVGLVPRTLRVAPACAIMIATFEYGKSVFEAFNIKRTPETV